MLGYRIFVRWQTARFVHRAEAFLDAGDLRSARITAGTAFRINPSSPETGRLLARIAEMQNDTAAIGWRERVLAIGSAPIEDGIELVRTALQFQRIDIAEHALARLTDLGARLPAYYECKGRLAMAKKDFAAAQESFSEAVRLDPSNRRYQFSLAQAQMHAGSADIRLAASKILRQLLEDRQWRIPAARALRDYAVELKDYPALLAITEQLYSFPEATFLDRASYLLVLEKLQRPEFATRLTEMEHEASADPVKVAELLTWMISNHLPLFATNWIQELSPEILKKRPVPLAVADAYAASGDWDRVFNWCKDGNWEDLEFLRHAYLARVAHERGDDIVLKTEWSKAVLAAGADGQRLFALVQSAVKWNFKNEAEDLLWKLGKDPQKQNAALATLYQYYSEKRDTPDLYRVVGRLLEARPNDESLQITFAQLSFLLNLNLGRASSLVERLYQKDSANSMVAMTYAFSLYRKERYSEAAKIMSALKEDDLQKLPFAMYYGVFLAAAGEKAKASEYLAIASNARLMPEEQALLDRAQRR